MEPQYKSSNKFAPEQSMTTEEWEQIHNPVNETLREVINSNNLECSKKLYEIMKGDEE